MVHLERLVLMADQKGLAVQIGLKGNRLCIEIVEPASGEALASEEVPGVTAEYLESTAHLVGCVMIWW